MPKMKTHRASAKRMKKLPGGKVKRGSAFRRHLLTGRTADRKRSLRSSRYIHPANVAAVQKLLPY